MAARAAAMVVAALLVPVASAQYIYVANSGEDTVSKIDIVTNTEVARYATWFTPLDPNYANYPHGLSGPAPSRVARDPAGYLYVLNRFFPAGQTSTHAHRPVLLKIAPTGGTPGMAGNLGVTTSGGAGTGAVLQMHDANPQPNSKDNQIDPGEAADVRILWGKPIGTAGADEGALGRALCMDPSGYLWVGLHHTKQYIKVDPATGTQMLLPISTNTHMPYGCQVDTQGRLWSVDDLGSLAEIDTVTHQLTAIHNHRVPGKDYGRNYSLSLFNGCGSEPTKVYLSEWALSKTYLAYDPQAPPATAFSNPPGTAVPLFNSIAIAVDLNGNIVSGQYRGALGGRVIKTTPAGAVVWDTNSVNNVVVTVPTSDLHGLIIDENNDVWAVDRANNQVVKYSGINGDFIKKVAVGRSPYTYGNPPPPSCPCALIREQKITCEKQEDGTVTYAWSFMFTNNSPFPTAATSVDLSVPAGSPVQSLLPQTFTLSPAVPPKGQGTVSGTFQIKNPVPGTQVCFDIRLNEKDGWCCPLQRVCFTLPPCPMSCAKLEGHFKCQNGSPVLQLSVTNAGPTAAQGAQIFSNTAGVTISPQTTTVAFPQNSPVNLSLTVTGATPGQAINLSVMLHGPIDPKTGVYDWCCTATGTVTYPKKICPWIVDGSVFEDVNGNGARDSGDRELPSATVTLTDGKGEPRTTTSDATGMYRFDEVEEGTYRLSVVTPKGWRATAPKMAVHTVTVSGPPKGSFDFGFVKRP